MTTSRTIAGEVSAILDDYHVDPEAAHAAEDRLLEEFVRREASKGNRTAKTLLRLLDEKVRTRWYG